MDPSCRRGDGIGRLLRNVMDNEDRVTQERRKMGHERVPKSSEMGAIAHFFCKYVCWIDFPSDVLDGERLILHPLTNGIVAKFNMTRSFRSHIIRPLNEGLIVIVENGWGVGV